MSRMLEIFDKIGKEAVFLLHHFEGAAVRIEGDPRTRCFAKFSGCKEYELPYGRRNDMVLEAIVYYSHEITEKEYSEF